MRRSRLVTTFLIASLVTACLRDTAGIAEQHLGSGAACSVMDRKERHAVACVYQGRAYLCIVGQPIVQCALYSGATPAERQ